MINIGTARQIITEIHSIYPKGLRPQIRQSISQLAQTPPGFADKSLTKNLLDNYQQKLGKTKNFEISKYVNKAASKEVGTLFKKSLANLHIEIYNKTGCKINSETKLGILQGLNAAKNAGLKLPMQIALEFPLTKTLNGEFREDFPNTIFLYDNKGNKNIGKTTIHETVHLNDKRNSIFNTISTLLTKFIFKNEISKEIKDYATTDRYEFIACTAEKLISNNKDFSELNIKIQKLYNILKGPKLNHKT